MVHNAISWMPRWLGALANKQPAKVAIFSKILSDEIG